ncbi:hypothetical protein Ahia01_001366000 [Argonauta hians]
MHQDNAQAGENCRICAPGTFHNIETSKCQPCPKDQYQHKNGTTSCLRCPKPFRTNSEGTAHKGDCTDEPQLNVIIIVVCTIVLVLVILFLGAAVYHVVSKNHRVAIMDRVVDNSVLETYSNPLFKNKYNSSNMMQDHHVTWSQSERVASHDISPYFHTEHEFGN